MAGWSFAAAALANRATTPFRIAASGDSREEGFGVDLPEKRFIEKLATALRAQWPTTGVTNHATRNYIPINYISTTLVGTGQFTNTVTTSSPNNFGLGTRVSRFRAAGEGTTLTATATTIELAYTKSNVASSFNVAVDGGAPVLVSWTTTAVTPSQIYTISGLTNAQHTVVITWVSGDVYFEGAYIYRDEFTKGIQVFDAGHSGVTSATVLGSSATYFGLSLKAADPHLIIANPMTNDYGGNVDPAVYKTRMQTYITALKAGCTTMPTIVLTKEWPRNGTYTYTIDQYWAIIDQLVTEDADQALVAWDYAATMPPTSDNSLGYYYTDFVHEAEPGQTHRSVEFTDLMVSAIEGKSVTITDNVSISDIGTDVSFSNDLVVTDAVGITDGPAPYIGLDMVISDGVGITDDEIVDLTVAPPPPVGGVVGTDAIFNQLVALGFDEGTINDREYERLTSKVGLESNVGYTLQDLYFLAGERPRL